MQLLKVISSLDAKTLQKAELFFQSSYLNSNKTLAKAFSTILANSHQDIATFKNTIWESIHHEKKFDDASFRKLIHDITEKLMQFFFFEEIQNSKKSQLRYQSKFSHFQKLTELRKKLQKKLDKIQYQEDITYSESYYDLYSAQRYIIGLEDDFTRKRKYKNRDEFIANINRLNQLLETSFAIEKTRLLLLQRNFNLLTGDDIDKIDSTILKKIITKDGLNANVISRVYQQIYQLIVEERTDIKIEEIIEHLRIISLNNPEEAFELYQHLENYFGTKINQGENLYEDNFSLLKFGLESNILIIKDQLDPSEYRNIVVTACRLSEFEWALDFVDSYKNNLSVEYRQSAYSFNKARILMNMKRYDDAVDMLRDVEYEDITYNINSKLMLMHAFYELDEYEVLESTIKAFKVFLRRRRNISKSRKSNFTDHCDVLFNIIKADERKDPKRLIKAREILKANPGIPNKTWLSQRIDEIRSNLGLTEVTRN